MRQLRVSQRESITERLHRWRRVVAWLVLVVIGVAATSVALAGTRTGALLSDVQVKISDAEQRTVFDGTLAGNPCGN